MIRSGCGLAVLRPARRCGEKVLRVPCLLASVFLLLSCCLAAADVVVPEFEAGNKLYEQGKYAEAAASYEKLLHSGHASPPVYYNLGNAWFKAGALGRAIAAYREARQFTPRDPDLLANLQFARNQVQGPTLAPELWQKWLGRLSLNEWTVLTAVALWICFLLLAAQQFRPAWKPALRTWVLITGCATVLLGGICGFAARQNRSAQAAIVIAPDTTIRQGPLNEAPSAFVAHDGAELRVLDRKDAWLEVTADPRRIGWIRRDQVVLAPGA